MISIFPAILLRSGGLPFDSLKQLNWGQGKWIEKALQQKEQQLVNRSTLLEAIAKIQADTKNYQLKTHLGNLYKDIFKDRNFTLSKITSNLPEFETKDILLQQLSRYKEQQEEAQAFYEQFEKEYSQCFSTILPVLIQLSTNENLLNGLLMSSHSFYNRLISIQSKAIVDFRKKEMQTLRSLWKYVIRIALKTSPFSTFTQLSWKDLNEKSSMEILPESKVRINNFVFAYLQELLESYPPFYRSLFIQLNASIQVDEDYEFILNSRNLESIQQLEKDEVVDLVHDWLNLETKKVKFQDLIVWLGSQIDVEEEELEEFVLELIQIGLLEWKWEISGMDPNWEQKLIQLLDAESTDPFLLQLHQLLITLQKNANSFNQKELKERQTIQYDSCQVFRNFWEEHLSMLSSQEATFDQNVFRRISGSEFIFRPENIFFEDVVTERDFPLTENTIQDLAAKINQLLIALTSLKEDPLEYALLQFFKQHYEAIGKIDFLTFYHHYNFAKGTLYTASYLEEVNQFRSKWKEKLKEELVLTGEEVKIKLGDIESIANELVPEKTQTDNANSFGALIQPYQKNQKNYFFIDTCFTGFGKMFGRFLHLFPDEITNQLRANIQSLEGEEQWIENVDASYFNANLHPPLLQYEINVPGSQNQLPEQQQVSIKELELQYNIEKDSLELVNTKTGKQTLIFDYGFEALENRSPLYQMLTSFAKEQASHLKLTELINELYPSDENGVIQHPRIVLEENMVLQRQRWYFPKAFLPLKKAGESEVNYLLRVNQWRVEMGLPIQLFYAVNPTDIDTANITAEEKGKTKKDDYKPQYLDFYDPIAIQIFAKALPRVPLYLKCEEALPTSDTFLHSKEEQYVSEFVLQWNIPKKTKAKKEV